MQSNYVTKDADTLGHETGRAIKEPAAIGKPVGAFGLSFAIAVLTTAVLFTVKAFNPELEEWAEEAVGHAWFYQAVLALILFFGFGFVPMGRRLGGIVVAGIVVGSTVVGGLIILAAAAVMALGLG